MNSKNSIDARASGVKPKTDIARCSEAAASSQAQAPEHFRIRREIFTFLNSWKELWSQTAQFLVTLCGSDVPWANESSVSLTDISLLRWRNTINTAGYQVRT